MTGETMATDPVYQATAELVDVVNRYPTGIAGEALAGVLLEVVRQHNGCDGITAARMLVRTFESFPASKTVNDVKLNPDAIYAGMVYVRDLPPEKVQQIDISNLVPPEIMQRMNEPGAPAIAFVPPVEVDHETLERIFPGEADSVMLGITTARWLLWGSPAVRQRILRTWTIEDENVAAVIRRFLADVTTRQ